MSSFNNLAGNAPALALNQGFEAEGGVVTLYGSFQGASSTAGPVQVLTSSATTCAGFRGSWFSVSSISTGWYRVQLVGLGVSGSIVPQLTSANTNAQPRGLLCEPYAWLNSDGQGNSNVVAGSTAGYQVFGGGLAVTQANLTAAGSPFGFTLMCSRFDPGTPTPGATNANTFDIFSAQLANATAGGVGYAFTDVPSTLRVSFTISYKAVPQTP
jgi:hypothetical protein